MTDFKTFMRTDRDAAALAYCRGDGAPIAAIATDGDPASFFGPDGKVTKSAAAIKEAYIKGAKAFGPNGESRLDIVQMAEGGDIAYWSGLQVATVEMDGKRVPMTLRITELYRREDGDWKLVHRHADKADEGK